MRVRPLLALRALALAALAAAACSPAEADLEFPSVCLRVGTLSVPGAPGVSGEVAVPYSLDLSGVPLLQDQGTRLDVLEVLSVTLTPTQGAPDFSGITSGSLFAITAGNPAPLEVARLKPPATSPLVLQGTGANAASGVHGRTLPLELRLAGTAPATAWSADVVTCARGVVHAGL
jgi:hypothetical protein